MFNLTVYGNLLPIPSCDNRYGFPLGAFPQDSVAALIAECDNAMVVVRPDGVVFVNFDVAWFKAPATVLIPTDVTSVNAVLGSITSDPEAYLDDDDLMFNEDNPDAATDEHERVMKSFGWKPADPY